MPVPTLAGGSALANAAPAVFRWSPGDSRPPFTVVVLEEGYGEVLRRDGIGETRWRPDAAAAACLNTRGTYHWLVLADDLGRPVASPLGTFAIE